jgi:hypothetical protein
MITAVASVLAAGLSAGGYVLYVWAIVRGDSDPVLVAWLMWCAEYAVLLVAMSRMSLAGMALPAGQLAGMIVVAVTTAVRSPSRQWRPAALPFLGVAGGLAALSAGLGPLGSVVTICGVEAAGIVLTLRSVWRRPGAEPGVPWGMWCLAGAASLIAAGHTSGGMVYPLFFAAGGAVVVLTGEAGWRRSQGRHCVNAGR